MGNPRALDVAGSRFGRLGLPVEVRSAHPTHFYGVSAKKTPSLPREGANLVRFSIKSSILKFTKRGPAGDGEMKRSEDFLVVLSGWKQPALAVLLLLIVLLVVRSTLGVWASVAVAGLVLIVSFLLLRVWSD